VISPFTTGSLARIVVIQEKGAAWEKCQYRGKRGRGLEQEEVPHGIFHENPMYSQKPVPRKVNERGSEVG